MSLSCTTSGCNATFPTIKARNKHNTRFHNTPVKVTGSSKFLSYIIFQISSNYFLDDQIYSVDRALITGLLICPLCTVYSALERDAFKVHLQKCTGEAMDQDIQSDHMLSPILPDVEDPPLMEMNADIHQQIASPSQFLSLIYLTIY